MRRALALLVLGIVALSMLVSTTLPRAVSFQGGYWRCITGSAVKTGYVSISKSSNAHVLTHTWNYPAFYESNLGVWGYYKAYYVLWTWDDRSAWIKASYSGRVFYSSSNPPYRAYIYMYVDKYAVRGKTKVWFKIVMKPQYIQQLQQAASQLGADGLIRSLLSIWYSEMFVYTFIEPAEAAISNLILMYGVSKVLQMLINPVTLTCTGGTCKYELGPVHAWKISSDTAYDAYWGFSFEDDAGCDCFLWWCWNCEYEYPSANLGLGIIADPTPENVTVTLTRVVYVNGSGAYLTVTVGFPKDYNVAIPVPSDAEVKKYEYEYNNETRVLVNIIWKKPFKSLNDLPPFYIVVNGTKVYPPSPNLKLEPTTIKSPQNRTVYMSSSAKVENGVLATTIVFAEETPSQMPIELYIAVAALVIASATFALVVVPKIAKTVVSETVRRKFVKPRSSA